MRIPIFTPKADGNHLAGTYQGFDPKCFPVFKTFVGDADVYQLINGDFIFAHIGAFLIYIYLVLFYI
jgi:hypothetical protein